MPPVVTSAPTVAEEVPLVPPPATIDDVLALLAQAPEPILATEDNGRTWSALGPGLRAEQALRVYAAPDDAWWVSLARGGLMRYDDASRDPILALKRADRLDLVPAFARWMQRPGVELLAEADLIVPVPLHRSRLWQRRFNQSALLAR